MGQGINPSVAALVVQRQLAGTDSTPATPRQCVATGMRINSARQCGRTGRHRGQANTAPQLVLALCVSEAAYSVRMVQPVVLRASRSRCACCTCSSG